MTKRILPYIMLLSGLVGYNGLLSAQIGGTQTYSFLTLPNSARVAAFGGKIVSVADDDLNLAYYNPSVLNQQMGNNLTMNYTDYFADINYGYASYAFQNKGENVGTWAAGIYFIHYGKFTEADEIGTILGEFSASEYAVNIMYSRPLTERIQVGVNIKPVLSYFERYSSYGIASDWGAIYQSEGKRFSSGLVLRNLGIQLSSYNDEVFNREPLPFEILAGLSFKPRHAPFRLSFTFHQLQKPNLTYDSPLNEEKEQILIDTEELPEEYEYDPPLPTGMAFTEMFYTLQGFYNHYADPFFRHLNLSVEFLPFDNFTFTLGYNYQRRQELKLQTKQGLVGFSFGMGITVRKIHVSYGRASYHLAGGTNNFSIRIDLSQFYR